jgi:hypothetical protein
MLATVLMGLLAFTLVFFALFTLRYAVGRAEDRLDRAAAGRRGPSLAGIR